MEQSLADRGDGEQQIDTKVGGVHSMDCRIQSSQLCDIGLSLLIMQENSKS